jgi:hypothetical protein
MIFSEAMKCGDQGQSAELGEMMAQGVKSAHPGMQPHVAHPWMCIQQPTKWSFGRASKLTALPPQTGAERSNTLVGLSNALT